MVLRVRNGAGLSPGILLLQVAVAEGQLEAGLVGDHV